MSRTGRAGWIGWASAVAATALALPGAAVGAPPASAPPGNSAVNQYTESYPSAEGPKISNAAREHPPRPPRKALGAENARRLQLRGAAGRAVADLVAATAPIRGAAGPGGEGGGKGGAGAVAGEVLGTSSSGKLGLALPLIILATLVWSVSYLLRRRPPTP